MPAEMRALAWHDVASIEQATAMIRSAVSNRRRFCMSSMRKAGGMCRIVVAAALAYLSGPSVAEACSSVYRKHELDAAEQQIDRQPPAAAQVADDVVRVLRRGIRADTSCANIGLIEIAFTGAKDDRTPRERIGYRITHVAGTLPYGLSLPRDARPATLAGDASGEVFLLALMWPDPATSSQAPIDFTIALTAVDLAGNESALSSPIRIRHPGGKPDR